MALFHGARTPVNLTTDKVPPAATANADAAMPPIAGSSDAAARHRNGESRANRRRRRSADAAPPAAPSRSVNAIAEGDGPDIHSEFVNRLTDFIRANLGASLVIPLLAQQVHLSAFHFARLFKETTGTAPHQFVIFQRLEAASRLLTDTTLTIAEITYQTGFSSQSQLAKLFRRWRGITPIEFRRSSAADSPERHANADPDRIELGRDSKKVVARHAARTANFNGRVEPMSETPEIAAFSGEMQ